LTSTLHPANFHTNIKQEVIGHLYFFSLNLAQRLRNSLKQLIDQVQDVLVLLLLR